MPRRDAERDALQVFVAGGSASFAPSGLDAVRAVGVHVERA
jgi:hypothetical protein